MCISLCFAKVKLRLPPPAAYMYERTLKPRLKAGVESPVPGRALCAGGAAEGTSGAPSGTAAGLQRGEK